MKKAVFLDRDGVLVYEEIRTAIPSPATFLICYDDAEQALRRLKQAGFWLIVVTNQPDIARGLKTQKQQDRENIWLRNALPVDTVLVCDHDDRDNCDCRKPKPGLITWAAEQFNIDLHESFLIGDRMSDMQAGAAAGVRSVMLDRPTQGRPVLWETYCANYVHSLAEAADWILQQ